MTRRKVYWSDPGGDRLGAEFWMEGRSLQANYPSGLMRRMFETEGIVTVGDRTFFPRDGRDFYDALPTGLAQASRIFVRDEPGS